jgi:hypothetical protein
LLMDAHILVTDPELRPMLTALIRAPGGSELITRLCAGRPGNLRAQNRELVRERLGL